MKVTTYKSNIICPYCNIKLGRWANLVKHIQMIHHEKEVPEWIIEQVRIRRQQCRNEVEPKEVCPACQKEYLKPCYGQTYPEEKLKWFQVGMYCPGCDYIRRI